MIDIKIVPIDSVKPSTYNPRASDEERLSQIELSLRKLGFVLPIFADKNGEILSGHQRHLVATRMGAKFVPVCFTKELTLEERKAYNIAFNRGTNDVDRKDTSESVKKKLNQCDLKELISRLPDIEVGSNDFYACKRVKEVPIRPLLEKNISRLNIYNTNMAKMLKGCGAYMPIVVDEENNVINGIGRLQMFAEMKLEKVDVVVLDHDHATFAQAMLNYLTMDFDIHNRYRDLLRYNSFRRSITNRAGIGRGFIAGLFPNQTKKTSFTGKELAAWTKKYGTCVVDFGAGRLTDTAILKELGIDCTPFEPYLCKGNEIDKPSVLNIAENFLRAVEQGKKFNTVFISSVFNSVPYREYREKIAVIASALCSTDSMCVCWTMNKKAANYQNIFRETLAHDMSQKRQFRLEYEDGIIVGNISDKPKVQKFHTVQELAQVFYRTFRDVRTKEIGDSIYLEARNPIRNRERLKEALEFEFELPYPDGTTMGMSKRAKEAFSKRLGVVIE